MQPPLQTTDSFCFCTPFCSLPECVPLLLPEPPSPAAAAPGSPSGAPQLQACSTNAAPNGQSLPRARLEGAVRPETHQVSHEAAGLGVPANKYRFKFAHRHAVSWFVQTTQTPQKRHRSTSRSVGLTGAETQRGKQDQRLSPSPREFWARATRSTAPSTAAAHGCGCPDRASGDTSVASQHCAPPLLGAPYTTRSSLRRFRVPTCGAVVWANHCCGTTYPSDRPHRFLGDPHPGSLHDLRPPGKESCARAHEWSPKRSTAPPQPWGGPQVLLCKDRGCRRRRGPS